MDVALQGKGKLPGNGADPRRAHLEGELPHRFLQHGVDELYIDQGHVRPLGNQLVAEAVVEALRPWFEARLGISGKEATP